MRLAHQLVDLRVRCEVDDEVDVGVLDAVDSAPERRVVPCEVLEEIRELVRPLVLALDESEHVQYVALEAQR